MYRKKGVAKKGTQARPWAGATGLYMVAPSCPANFYDGETCTNPVPKSVKIGKATGKGGLASRIGSYSTYWPHGTTIHAVMITPSYDEKYGTIRDYASARETTLKRILRQPEVDVLGFGSNGKGGKNGSEKVETSEWVRMQPSELIRYFDAVGPKRHPGDRLYTCNANQCQEVPRDGSSSPKVRQTRARATAQHATSKLTASNWKELEAVLKNEAELGIPGRPVVLTKGARNAAMRPGHAFHKWAAQLITDQTQQNQLAQRRLQDKEARNIKKADNERKEKLKGVLSRAATKRIEREYKEYKRRKPKLPRDLAAVQNTVAFRYAPKQLRPVIMAGIPTRPRPTRTRPTRTKAGGFDVERAKKVDAFAFDTFGVPLRAGTSDPSPMSTPSLGAYPNQRYHYDRAKTATRKRAEWAMDNERLPLRLEKAIYERSFNEANLPQTPKKAPKKAPKRAPKKAPSPLRGPSASRTALRACPLVSRRIKQYSHYTHHDVTGDGRCYFYVLLKALGMQLTNQKGAVANLNRFFENNYYFTPRNKRQLEREVRNGTYGNPERIIEYSPAIRKLLWDRNIRYIATIQKTHDTPQAVDEYITNPMRHLVHLSKLHDPPTVKLKSFTLF